MTASNMTAHTYELQIKMHSLVTKTNAPTHVFNPDCADNNVVNTAVDILPRVCFAVSALTENHHFKLSYQHDRVKCRGGIRVTTSFQLVHFYNNNDTNNTK